MQAKIVCVIFCVKKNLKLMPIFCKNANACSIVAMPPKVISPVQTTAVMPSGKLSEVISRQPCVISIMPLNKPIKIWLSQLKMPLKKLERGINNPI